MSLEILTVERSELIDAGKEPRMCLISCEVGEGLIPAERVARLTTADGKKEEVVVSERQVKGQKLMAAEIGRQGDRVLVELPRESCSGQWRLWVHRDQIGS